MKVSEALLYARTLRHLRPAQLLGRARRALPRVPVDRAPAPQVRGDVPPLAAPARRAPVLVGPTRVEMLGEAGDLAGQGDWDDAARTALWRYHAHYFDDLRAEGAADRATWNDALIARWLGEVAPDEGVGWDAYPTSLRIVNWVRWGLASGLTEAARQSLAEQARHVRANLEWHILGNHLLANAKALVFAGAYFTGREADEWRGKGLALLRRELSEQVLPDGGHFERSPMYHALVLEDVLDVIALVQAAPAAFADAPGTEKWLSGVSAGMRVWQSAMCHPDGEIALFNDAAFGQAPSPAALEDYAARLGRPAAPAPRPGATLLADTGYVRVERGPAVALLDVGEIGPRYLPGHAHADSLSFELSVAGQRVVVNGGTSQYEPGPERLRQRGTAAHSTVEVDGADSSEVWSSFRVARRAHPRGLAVDEQGGAITVRCAHDGYRRLPGRVTHARGWRFDGDGVSLHDALEGSFDAAVSRLHLHPGVRAEAGGPAVALVREGAGALTLCATGGSAPTVASGTWHPGFGRSLPNHHVRCALSPAAPALELQLTW